MPTQPNRPGLAIAIGLTKPKSKPPAFGAPDGVEPDEPAPSPDGHSGKATPEEAACFDANLKCASCSHYQPGDHPDLGTCEKVEGESFGPSGDIVGCVKYFEPGGGAGYDETGGGAPGGDTGDAPGSAPAQGGY